PTFSGGRGWRWARGAAPPHRSMRARSTLYAGRRLARRSPQTQRVGRPAAGTATLAELVCRPAAVFSRPAAVFSRPTACGLGPRGWRPRGLGPRGWRPPAAELYRGWRWARGATPPHRGALKKNTIGHLEARGNSGIVTR